MDADFLLAYHHVPHHHHVHHSHVRSTPRVHRSTDYDNHVSGNTGTNMLLLNSARHRTHTTMDSTRVSNNLSASHNQDTYTAFGIFGTLLLVVVGVVIYKYFKEEE